MFCLLWTCRSANRECDPSQRWLRLRSSRCYSPPRTSAAVEHEGQNGCHRMCERARMAKCFCVGADSYSFLAGFSNSHFQWSNALMTILAFNHPAAPNPAIASLLHATTTGAGSVSRGRSPITRLRAYTSCLTMIAQKFTIRPTPKRKKGQSDWTLLPLRRWRGLEWPFRMLSVVGNNEFGSHRRVTGEPRRSRRRRDHVLGQNGRPRPDAPELFRWAKGDIVVQNRTRRKERYA